MERVSKRLTSAIFNESRSISHVHCYGSTEQSLDVRRLLERNEEWVSAYSDFIYVDGSMKLFLESIASQLRIKSKGENVEEFLYSVKNDFLWYPERPKKLMIFITNAHAVVKFSPLQIRSFFNSPKNLRDVSVRIVTYSTAPWQIYQSHIGLGNLPIVQVRIPSLESDEIMKKIAGLNMNVSDSFIRFAVESLALHCRSITTLVRIIHEAYEKYITCVKNTEKLDPSKAGECLMAVAEPKIGVYNGKLRENDGLNDSFHLMSRSMRYLLISTFCASNNAALSDKRFFAKHHGKEKRSELRELRDEVNRHLKDFEPKLADLQRVHCIYKVFVQNAETKEHFMSELDVKNIMSSLDSIGLVQLSSSNLSQPKLKCLISLESAVRIAESLNIQLREYLENPV